VLDFLGAIGSVATGGVTGLIGAGISQFMEHKKQKTEYQHQLENRRLDMEMMVKKADLAKEEKQIDADIVADQEAGKDFRESFSNDRASYSDPTRAGVIVSFLLGVVDTVRGLIRPSSTIFFCVITYRLSIQLLDTLGGVQNLPPDQLLDMLNRVIQTILYLTTTCILWWFGTRPPKMVKYTEGG